ncbi:hypothetical protein [Nocardia sp. R7R-8]
MTTPILKFVFTIRAFERAQKLNVLDPPADLDPHSPHVALARSA